MATLSTTQSRFPALTGLSCLLLLGAGVSANAQVTLNFENYSNPNSGAGYNNIGSTVSQNGFTITDTGPITGNQHSISPDGALMGYNYTGSVAIFNGSTNGSDTLMQDNSHPFQVNSIDIANNQTQASRPGGVTVTFTGQVDGGGTVTKSFTHAANDSLTTVAFDSSFANLDSFTINQTSPYNQFDNVVINRPTGPAATPEPGSVAMLVGMGITGVGFAARRKRRK
jgi:hypothetical protein